MVAEETFAILDPHYGADIYVNVSLNVGVAIDSEGALYARVDLAVDVGVSKIDEPAVVDRDGDRSSVGRKAAALDVWIAWIAWIATPLGEDVPFGGIHRVAGLKYHADPVFERRLTVDFDRAELVVGVGVP